MQRKFFLIVLIIVFMMAGCTMFKSASKEPITEPTNGFLIKIDKNDRNQRVLAEAVQVLEKLYGTPLVLVSGGLATAVDGTKVSVVRYDLYFEISESMYTVVPISNGIITEIIPISRASKVPTTKKMAVEKVLAASGISD